VSASEQSVSRALYRKFGSESIFLKLAGVGRCVSHPWLLSIYPIMPLQEPFESDYNNVLVELFGVLG